LTARVLPVEKEDWTPAQAELLGALEKTGRLWNVFRTLANHPALYKAWWDFATYILRDNSLPPRDREILILRIGWLCQSEYEWAQHVRIGKRAGLSDDDIRNIRQGADAPGLSEHDRLLIVATDELRRDSKISDATWDKVTAVYNTQQVMDLVFTVGQYNLVSMALKTLGVELDEGLEGFSAHAS
jgi:4-carboxymuconolactone decarboxylase